jgi:hypothetical protein
MSKGSGLGDNFYIGGYDLSGDVASLDQIGGGPNLGDVTAINKSAHERIGLTRDGGFQFTTWYEQAGSVSAPGVPASTTPVVSTYKTPVIVTVIGGTGTQVNINGVNQGTFDGSYVLPALGTIILTYTVAPTWSWTVIGTEHDFLSTLPTADEVATYLNGTTLLNPAAGCIGKQINYDGNRGNDGSLSFKVQVQANGFGLEWGKQITAGNRTDIAATTGSAIDENPSAGTAFGAQAYVQLVQFVGTSVTIDIQSATTSGGSYSTTGLTTSAMSAVGSQRLATANTATINEFLKIVTTGTFTLASFNVVFVRNQAAGQVF